MSKYTEIASASQLDDMVTSSRVVVAYFYSNTDVSCAALSPIFDELRPTFVTLAKVDIEAHRDIAAKYDVTPENVPTFIVFKFGRATDKLEGIEELLDALQVNPDLDGMDRGTGSAGEASSASGASWAGAGLPRGYKDVTDQVEIPRCELLNVDTELGGIRTLLDKTKPGALAGKTADKDWVESDTDEQLMLFLPFKSAIKLHTLQFTSLPPAGGDDDEAPPARPSHVKLYSNKPYNLGFDEAEVTAATQELELTEADWNANGTASIGLRFVKFQNITSLVVFVVSADGGAEKVRLDRVRLIGEAGEKREMGKLEKIGDEPGE